MRPLKAMICLVLLAVTVGCGGKPNSLFDAAGYHVRDGVVYYLEAFPGDATEIEAADPETFTIIDRTFAKDKSAVYLDGVVFEEADPASFELLDEEDFSRDADHVFLGGRVLTEDVDHFEFLLGGTLTRDSSNVYWSDGSVLSQDPGNFEIITSEDYYLFTRDSSTVYVNPNAIKGADPDTFEVIEHGYTRDAEEAFYFSDPIPGADLDSLEVLEGSYARDDVHAYWMGEPIPGADPATFVVLNEDFECTADSERAYYRDMVIQGFDRATLPEGAHVNNCTETFLSFQ